MFSVIIPTYNNLNYLKICLKSLEKNSKYNNEIIMTVLITGVAGLLGSRMADWILENSFYLGPLKNCFFTRICDENWSKLRI